MSIVQLYGHHALRSRFLTAINRESSAADNTNDELGLRGARRDVRAARGSLSASILLQGTRGIGKQRLALWLAQALLCDADDRPCGHCAHCRASMALQHPDMYWVYPKPRLKAPDPSANDVLSDYAESTAERVEQHGLYAPSSGSDGLFIATTRTIVQRAGLAPAMARHKVFVVGDAERMISQEGADQAANAFLKLLEEPPADTTIILTSSEPGALLPTIRSRVVAFRCAPLPDSDARSFLTDPIVDTVLTERGVPKSLDERVALAGGAPGVLLATDTLAAAMNSARELLRVAESRGSERYEIALQQGVSNARGSFTDILKALNVILRDETRAAVRRGDDRAAYRSTQGIDAVAKAQARAEGNVNPQLVTARLLRDLAERRS